MMAEKKIRCMGSDDKTIEYSKLAQEAGNIVCDLIYKIGCHDGGEEQIAYMLELFKRLGSVTDLTSFVKNMMTAKLDANLQELQEDEVETEAEEKYDANTLGGMLESIGGDDEEEPTAEDEQNTSKKDGAELEIHAEVEPTDDEEDEDEDDGEDDMLEDLEDEDDDE